MGSFHCIDHILSRMKQFLVLASLVAASYAVPMSAKGRMNGDPSILFMCVNGTALGDKIEDNFNNCFGEVATRIARARMTDDCPSQDEVMEQITNEYADDACMLYGMGWIDNSGDWDNDTIAEDLGSLDANLVEGLDQEGWAGCVAEHTEWAVNHPCANSYDEYAHHVGKMIIEYECHALLRKCLHEYAAHVWIRNKPLFEQIRCLLSVAGSLCVLS